MHLLLAAFRTQLRLRWRAPSSWALTALGLLLTCWGTLLDILAVGVEEGRPLAIAHTSGGLIGVLLGAWIGSGTPARYSLDESRDPWSALPGAAWALPAARLAVAAVISMVGAVLCMLYTLVLRHPMPWGALGWAAVAAGLAGALAAAWAALLTPRVGSLAAVAGTLGLAAAATAPIPATLRALLPVAPPAELVGGVGTLASLLALAGLLSLTPRSPRADGRAEPAS